MDRVHLDEEQSLDEYPLGDVNGTPGTPEHKEKVYTEQEQFDGVVNNIQSVSEYDSFAE